MRYSNKFRPQWNPSRPFFHELLSYLSTKKTTHTRLLRKRKIQKSSKLWQCSMHISINMKILCKTNDPQPWIFIIHPPVLKLIKLVTWMEATHCLQFGVIFNISLCTVGWITVHYYHENIKLHMGFPYAQTQQHSLFSSLYSLPIGVLPPVSMQIQPSAFSLKLLAFSL